MLARLAAAPGDQPAAAAEPEPDSAQAAPRGSDRSQVAQVLAAHRGNRSAAARKLGVSERTLYRWLREERAGAPD
ncbi:MAG: helix-turn-helix domain-containing protein [Piscinibacter sp.]|nr:helix-turn-helix domain-containing protein [Piscinibacter sp.]